MSNAASVARALAAVALTAVLPPLGAQAAKESRMSNKPIPLQVEIGQQLFYEDVLDYSQLVQKIKEQSAQGENTPGGRVWMMINPTIKPKLEGISGDIDRELEYEIQTKLNNVIRRHDLYDPEAFQGVDLGEYEAEVQALLSQGVANLSAPDVSRLNRILLQQAFPDVIVESDVTPYRFRRPLLLEVGQNFLGTGPINKGIELPTGAVWQPYLISFGSFRTGVNFWDAGGPGRRHRTEWVNRLDLFFNLFLTASERILIGFQPLHRDGEFTGYFFQPESAMGPGSDDGFHGPINTKPSVFFFEGDIGEMFPNLDPRDVRRLDLGISVGRQPLFFQEGIMMNDVIDAVALVRNSNLLPLTAKNRITALFGWYGVNRNNAVLDEDAKLFGLFTSTDFTEPYFSTVDLDFAHIVSGQNTGEDATFIGLSAVQRIRGINTAFRVNSSIAYDEDSTDASNGTLFLSELSWTPPYTDDLLYATGFWAIDQYSMAARDPSVGGPLGRAGILFEGAGLGGFPAALSPQASDVVGGALGYQKFFGEDRRKQVILETGFRADTEEDNTGHAGAIGARYQQAIGQHLIWRVDGFMNYLETRDDQGYGVRTEIQYNF